MNSKGTTTDIVFPVEALTHLRRSLRDEAGALGATHALHGAGYRTGAGIFEALAAGLETEDAASAGERRFWRDLDGFVARRGWGRVEHARVHPGMGMLVARDWMESDPAGEESQPGCAFTTGLLAHVLGRVADGPVAVLEVACRSRGDGECRFLFGSEGAVHEIYGLLLDGESLDRALERV